MRGRGWWLRGALLAVLAGLLAGDRALLRRQEAARDGRQRIGRLVPPERRDALSVAAFSIAQADSARQLYARISGTWRCLTFQRALADEAALGRLLEALLAAEGVVQSDDRTREADYGLDADSVWHVGLHGSQVLEREDGDTQFAAEIGASIPGLEGCFVRRRGEPAVWAVDADLRALLDASVRPGWAPLLDARVLPGIWPAAGQHLVRVAVERADGSALALQLREVELAPEEQAPGVSPFRWLLQRSDGSEVEPHPILATSFVNFLRLAEASALLPPPADGAAALEVLHGRLALETNAGERLLLLVGEARADGAFPVWNERFQTLALLTPEIAGLLLPSEAQLVEGATGNPWQPYLERAATPMPSQGR